MIDILLSTYNSSDFIQDLFFSLKNQTFKEWRLIIRDDLSQDKTREVVEHFCSKESRAVFIKDRIKLGTCQSFFRLLKHSDSDYIMFCDHDDIWLKEKIEKMLSRMLELENRYGRDFPILIHTDLFIVDENLNIISDSFWKYQGLNPEFRSLNYLLVQNNVTGCSMMINRALKSLIKIPKKAIMHDWWIALVASAFGIIDYIKEPLLLYRKHKGQTIGAKKYPFGYKRFVRKPKEAFFSVLKTIEQAKEFYSLYKERLSEDQKRLILNYFEILCQNRLKRIRAIVNCRFFKQNKIGNIGFIGTVLAL